MTVIYSQPSTSEGAGRIELDAIMDHLLGIQGLPDSTQQAMLGDHEPMDVGLDSFNPSLNQLNPPLSWEEDLDAMLVEQQFTKQHQTPLGQCVPTPPYTESPESVIHKVAGATASLPPLGQPESPVTPYSQPNINLLRGAQATFPPLSYAQLLQSQQNGRAPYGFLPAGGRYGRFQRAQSSPDFEPRLMFGLRPPFTSYSLPTFQGHNGLGSFLFDSDKTPSPSSNSPHDGRPSDSFVFTNRRPVIKMAPSSHEGTRASAPLGACMVCGDVAACQHYGVLSCEGCKGFFKRSVQKRAEYKCNHDGSCSVRKATRNRCQACRYKRCLEVGMVKQVVRMDSLKGKRGRLPKKPRTLGVDLSNPNQTSMATAITRAYEDAFRPSTMSDVQECEQTTESIELARKILDFWPTIVEWAKRVPGFATDIRQIDQEILLRQNFLHVFSVYVAYKSVSTYRSHRIVIGSTSYSVDQQKDDLLRSWLSGILQLAEEMHAGVEIDPTAFACLMTYSLFLSEGNIVEPEPCDRLKSSVIDALKDHCSAMKSQGTIMKTNYFQQVIDREKIVRALAYHLRTALHECCKLSPKPFATIVESILGYRDKAQ